MSGGEGGFRGGWAPIETAPTDRPFLALGPRWDVRRCWRHRPSSRTDEILTWARNGKFRATHWMPLPELPALAKAAPADGGSSTAHPSPTPDGADTNSLQSGKEA